MSIFKKSKTPTVVDRRNARDDLAQRLEVARADAVQAVLDGADSTRQTVFEDKIHRAEISFQVLQNALVKLDADISDQERAEAAAADRATREATARDLNSRADKLDKAAAPVAKILADLKEAVDGCTEIVGAIGMPGLLAELTKALPDGCAVIAAEVRARAEATMKGSAPASLPKKFEPQVVPEPPKGPTIQIFTLEKMTWKDERGQLSRPRPFQRAGRPDCRDRRPRRCSGSILLSITGGRWWIQFRRSSTANPTCSSVLAGTSSRQSRIRRL